MDLNDTFSGLWPYPARFVDTPDGQQHYIDIGPADAAPVVLVHGNPSWGVLFRDVITAALEAGHRVIVPDHLGFGRSDKPRDLDAHRSERHAERLSALLDSLDLHDVTLVLHDWGGPFGLPWAGANPARLRALVLMQTFASPPEHPRLPVPLRLFKIPGLGRILVTRMQLVLRAFLLGSGVARRERLTPELRRAYLAPFPTPASRVGMLALARQFPDVDFQRSLPVGELQGVPTVILWGERDSVLSLGDRDRLSADFPAATVRSFAEASHFLPEDAPAQVRAEILALSGPSVASGNVD